MDDALVRMEGDSPEHYLELLVQATEAEVRAAMAEA